MTRDLNGHPVQTGGLRRLFSRVRGGSTGAAEPAPGDTDLVVVAQSFDDAAASSQVLADSSWRENDQVVVRHLLAIPPARRADVADTAGQDGYEIVDGVDLSGSGVPAELADGVGLVVLARTQLLDVLHLSQERSRMAGLGARHDGTVLGWQVLQRPES